MTARLQSIRGAAQAWQERARLVPTSWATTMEIKGAWGCNYPPSSELLMLARMGLVEKREILSFNGVVLSYLWRRTPD